MFTLATLEMHPFQMTITNANNTKVIAYINYQHSKYPFDDYAYEFMVMNHTQYIVLMNLACYSLFVWLLMNFVSIQKQPTNNIKITFSYILLNIELL